MQLRSLPLWVFCEELAYTFMVVVLVGSNRSNLQFFVAHVVGLCTLGITTLFWCDALELAVAVLRWPPVLWSLLLALGAYNRDALFDFVCSFLERSLWAQIFYGLAVFKFVKVVVHLISYNLYKAAPVPAAPTIISQNVTVIIPSVGNFDEEFVECVRSILACNPAEVIISTIGEEKLNTAQQVIRNIGDDRVHAIRYIGTPSKRQQVMAAVDVQHPNTKITVLADDHVFWPTTFLRSALAPFEDPLVGHVGTVKRVRRVYTGRFVDDLLNYIACIYLERHNFECTASYAVDGGVFVISGRTALIRTQIIWDPKFKSGFLNETWLGRGPLNVDDDNFITRWMVKYGYKVVFHNTNDALMETSLGIEGITKFRGQLLRWARTTWRSNSTSLLVDRVVWYSQPWSVYAVYLSAFVNFALFYDIALCYTYLQTSKKEADLSTMPTDYYDVLTGRMRAFIGLGIQISPLAVPYVRVIMLVIVLFASKLVKVWSHLWRNPYDWVFLPFGILFGYCHSLIKLHALITCRNTNWGTRSGVDNEEPVNAIPGPDPASIVPIIPPPANPKVPGDSVDSRIKQSKPSAVSTTPKKLPPTPSVGSPSAGRVQKPPQASPSTPPGPTLVPSFGSPDAGRWYTLPQIRPFRPSDPTLAPYLRSPSTARSQTPPPARLFTPASPPPALSVNFPDIGTQLMQPPLLPNSRIKQNVSSIIPQKAVDDQKPLPTPDSMEDGQLNIPKLTVSSPGTPTPGPRPKMKSPNCLPPVYIPQEPCEPQLQDAPSGLLPPANTPQTAFDPGLLSELRDASLRSSPARPKSPRSAGALAPAVPLWKAPSSISSRRVGREATPRALR